MRKTGWIMLALLILATVGLLAWSLSATPQAPTPVADDEAPPPVAAKVLPPVAPRPAPMVQAEPRPGLPPPPKPPEPVPPPLTVVTGVVIDPQGNPAPFAQVSSASEPFEIRAVADQDGKFQLASDSGPVLATHEQFGPSEPSAPRPGGSWQLRLGPGGRLEGRVLDGQGRPVAGARVDIVGFRPAAGAPAGHRPVPSVVSDAAGAFAFSPLAPGTYDLRAIADGRVPGTANAIALSANGRADADIHLPAGALVRGRVTSKVDGKPIAGAQVVAGDPSSAAPGAAAVTDAEGRFEVKGIAPGRTSLRVHHPDFRPEVVSGIVVSDGGEAQRDVLLAVKQPGEHFAFQGIGASLRRDGDAIVIGGIMADSPAGRAGLQTGDRIVAVDRGAVQGLALPQVVERIRGEAGSVVLIEVERPGQGRMTIQVDRGEVVVKDPE